MAEEAPHELTPAYDRPVDKDSIDARMNAQLEWEALAAPRRRHEHRRRGSTLKRAAAGVGILAATTGAVELVGRAIDQNVNQYNSGPTRTEHIKPGQGFYNTYKGKDGKLHIYYDRSGAELISVKKH